RLKGGLWLGFQQGGVAYVRGGQVAARYMAAQGLGGGWVSHLRLDRDGTLWAATEGGLSRLKDGRIATLARKNGLPCDSVHWSIQDDTGALWLNMSCGLVQVARSDMEAWVADSNHSIRPTIFDSSDGVRSFSIPVGYSPRVAKTADGKLWFDV